MSATFTIKKQQARDRIKDTTPARALVPSPQAEAVRRVVVPFEHADDYIREIETLWHEATERFLDIGRWLNKAKVTLAHGDFQRMVEERLPFDKSRAYQLRMVAGMVDSGRVEEPDLPRASATAFLFANLDRASITRAKADGVLRPDVRRQEVQEWKRRVLGRPKNSAEIQRVRAALLAKIARYEDELEAARAQLAELDAAARTIEGTSDKV